MPKPSNYMTRAMASHDPRFGRIMSALGAPQPAGNVEPKVLKPSLEDELSSLRTEYQEVVGKRAYHAWDATDLREKITAAKAA